MLKQRRINTVIQTGATSGSGSVKVDGLAKRLAVED